MIITAKEIKEKLDELNLTLDPQERNRKRRWFFERNIRLITYRQQIMQEPKTPFTEIVAHMKILMEAHSALKNIFSECKQENIVLKYEDGKYKSKDTMLSSTVLYYVAMANAYVEEIKAERKWFKERNLLVKLIQAADISEYVFLGSSEISPHETKK